MKEETKSEGNGNIRYLVCFICWLSIFSLFAQRFNLPIAIIGMVGEKYSENTTGDFCSSPYKNKVLIVNNNTQKYNWNEKKQNFLLFALNVGYLVGHIPGGLLSNKYGPRMVMIFCLSASTVLTILSIPAANNFWLFFVVRSLIGLVNGPLVPIIHQTIANYAPTHERTRLILLTHTGTVFSFMFIFPIGSYLLENSINGWRWIFVISGFFGTLSFILWTLFVYSLPEKNPWMSSVEKKYILKSSCPNGRTTGQTVSYIPFHRILTSRHIYVFICAHFGKLFILYMNLFGLVRYFFTNYDLTPRMAGNLAVIPFIINVLSYPIYLKSVEFLKGRKISITNKRKLNTFIGAFGSAMFLMIAGFLPCNNIPLGVLVLSLSLMFLPPYQAGYFTAIIEFAPQYSDINIAIINLFGSLSGSVQRHLTSILVTNISDVRLAYRYSFIITAIVSFLLSMVFVVFGTADLQPWAKVKSLKVSNSTFGVEKESLEVSVARD